MKALVLSDAHFGAWTGEDILRHDAALDVLAPVVREVDEVVLLGDLFDWLFGTVTDAVARADRFFALLHRELGGKRVVFLAGNHDHHAMVRELRDMVELNALFTGDEAGLAHACERHRSFIRDLLERRLPETEVEIAYPAYCIGEVLCTHGHYLDAHVEGTLAEKLLARSGWSLAGGQPHGDCTIADYESAMVPLTELLFTVAQLPRGTHAQKEIQERLQHVAHALAVIRAPVRELRRLSERLADFRTERGREELAGDDTMIARGTENTAPPQRALEAFAQVVRDLRWREKASNFVFAHTHQPLAGATVAGLEGAQFWNTGSWIYEPPRGSRDQWERYLEHAWPGTAVLIDTSRRDPELLELLAGYNPLRAGGAAPPWPPPDTIGATLSQPVAR
jgi:UDP-2,3-diacylglucosamine pyrophosphatase LpxH